MHQKPAISNQQSAISDASTINNQQSAINSKSKINYQQSARRAMQPWMHAPPSQASNNRSLNKSVMHQQSMTSDQRSEIRDQRSEIRDQLTINNRLSQAARNQSNKIGRRQARVGAGGSTAAIKGKMLGARGRFLARPPRDRPRYCYNTRS
jgi:hypothetical protein